MSKLCRMLPRVVHMSYISKNRILRGGIYLAHFVLPPRKFDYGKLRTLRRVGAESGRERVPYQTLCRGGKCGERIAVEGAVRASCVSHHKPSMERERGSWRACDNGHRGNVKMEDGRHSSATAQMIVPGTPCALAWTGHGAGGHRSSSRAQKPIKFNPFLIERALFGFL